MVWDLTGMRVKGVYLNQHQVVGKVRLSRVRYGGSVSHHIDLETPINLYGALRDSVILDHDSITQVMDDNK